MMSEGMTAVDLEKCAQASVAIGWPASALLAEVRRCHEGVERTVALCHFPKPEKYARCADLILDTIEESLGIEAPNGRNATRQAIIATLAFYFPEEGHA